LAAGTALAVTTFVATMAFLAAVILPIKDFFWIAIFHLSCFFSFVLLGFHI
jgi:hypothetical protein